jgi:hypothetical protein
MQMRVKGRVAPLLAQRLLDDPELHVIPRPAVYQVAVDVRPGDTF